MLNVKCREQYVVIPRQRVWDRPFCQPMFGFVELILHNLPFKDIKSGVDDKI